MEYAVCNTVIKVDLGLGENQEIDLRKSYHKLKKMGIDSRLEQFSQVRALRFTYKNYFFNVFHTGKIQVFTKNNFKGKDFENAFNDLSENVFDSSIVQT